MRHHRRAHRHHGADESTGPDLAPAVVTTLGEPFQRGSGRTRTSDHAGVGLGLAIVRSIARAHDGGVTLTPRAGGWLEVTVELPAAPAACAAGVRQPESVPTRR